jgi:enoyl-CoA hydratase
LIRVDRTDAVAILTVDRQDALNALDVGTLTELRDRLGEVAGDEAVRAVILTGAGERAFVAGADINELAKNNPAEAKAYTHKGQATLDLIENLGKPVIACVNGFALGGGCEIAMACTMRIASENAKLGQPEVKLGLIPGYGGTQRLPRLVGTGQAMQLLLTGEMISAQEAHRIGLVNEVVAADRLIPRAEEIAQKIIGMAPLAIQYCMEAVNQGMNMTLPEGLFLEATLFGMCCATEDKKEGTTAFLEKRAANFQGK